MWTTHESERTDPNAAAVTGWCDSLACEPSQELSSE
jgi:hypothetical protein